MIKELQKESGVKYSVGRSGFRTFTEGIEKEWLLTNGIGGFANQSIIGANTRIFSGYLIASFAQPVDRFLILANTHEAIKVGDKEYDLTSASYIGTQKEGYQYMNRFELDIIPTYIYEVNGIRIRKSISMEYGKNHTVICYEVEGNSKESTFSITPLFNCRPFGDVAEKSMLDFKTEVKELDEGGLLTLNSSRYPGVYIDFYSSCGTFYNRNQKKMSMATPNYLIEENEVYPIDNRNGFLGVDNHSTPMEVVVKIKPFEKKTFFLSCSAYRLEEDMIDKERNDELKRSENKDKLGNNKRNDEIINSKRKDGFVILNEYKNRMIHLMEQIPYDNVFAKRLAWAADAFIVSRKSTGLKTILAGYPWFSDWGRDTMIALQGLTLSTKRYQDARDILESFSRYVKDGMIPNVFPGNDGEEPEYNTIDASLWYFYSVYKYLEYTKEASDYQFIKDKIYDSLKQIMKAYQHGTHYGIKMDEDYLIEGGSDLDQLTWMDVRVGDWVVTPRHGKAVEINALWYNAICVMKELAIYFKEDSSEYEMLARKVKESFENKFWNKEDKCLYDVISKIQVNKNGTSFTEEFYDRKIRPNQIYAVSLPYTMLDREKEKQIVQVVLEELYTPYGLRSLSPEDKDYKSKYIGKLILRDGAYHMGTTWGYLLGGLITAMCKVEEHSKEVVYKAKEMCEYMSDHMEDGCMNGIAEIFDGDYSCTSRGCYTQAWSVGEVLRAYTEDVLPYLENERSK